MLPSGLQIPQSPSPITYSRLLIVEGRTAFEFFKALLRDLHLLDQIEIRNLGGNQELGDYLELLRITSGFGFLVMCYDTAMSRRYRYRD